jgi:membrane-associated protein
MRRMHHLALIPIIKMIGYPGIAAAVYLESGVFFGFFLPGASLLFTAGLLSSHNVFNVWILIPLVTVAAILGDNTGYWFGNKVGIKLFLRPNSRFFKHEHLEQAKDFYDRHGAVAIMLARFVPIVRTFAPIIAGMVNMRYRTFVFYNILGAVAWGSGVTFLGYFLGERFPFVERYLLVIVLVIIVATTVPLIFEFARRHYQARRG